MGTLLCSSYYMRSYYMKYIIGSYKAIEGFLYNAIKGCNLPSSGIVRGLPIPLIPCEDSALITASCSASSSYWCCLWALTRCLRRFLRQTGHPAFCPSNRTLAAPRHSQHGLQQHSTAHGHALELLGYQLHMESHAQDPRSGASSLQQT